MITCSRPAPRTRRRILPARLAGEELDIVDQQQVERVVVALEVVERLALVGLHHVGHVLLGVDVADPRAGLVEQQLVADRVDQVGLAEADAAVQEQRVVRDARVVRDLDRGGARELVGLTGHEVVEREHRVQLRALVHRIGFGAFAGAAPGRAPRAAAGRRFVRGQARQVDVGVVAVQVVRRPPTASAARRPARSARPMHVRSGLRQSRRPPRRGRSA
jgi:hypothetical protein